MASLLQSAVREGSDLLDGPGFGRQLAELFHRYLTVVGAPVLTGVSPERGSD